MAKQRFVLPTVAFLIAAGVVGCKKASTPRVPPLVCKDGLEYRIRPSPKEPGRLMIHALKNCSTSKTWWVNRRFTAAVDVYGEMVDVQLHLLKSDGSEVEAACVMENPPPLEAGDYAVLLPGETLEVEGEVFACTETSLGERFRVYSVFHNKNRFPPPPPAGAVLFTGALTSNEYEVQNLDYRKDELDKANLRSFEAGLEWRRQQEAKRSKRPKP